MDYEHWIAEEQECHECGVIGKPRLVMWLNHLCQHYFALCPKCMKRMIKKLQEKPNIS